MILLIRRSSQYNIKYHDCSKPSAIYKYQTAKLCVDKDVQKEQETSMSVLQRTPDKKLRGHSCQIITTRWWLYCGAYSHTKMAQIPEVEIVEGLSPTSCADLVNSLKFKRHGRSYKLEMNAETIVRQMEAGMIKDVNNAVSCKGITVNVNGEITDNMIIASQSRVILKEELLTISGKEVEVMGDHLTLDCQPNQGGCRTMDRTYIWAQQASGCPLKKVRDLKATTFATVDGEYWVDESANVVLKKMNQVAAPSGCPNILLSATEYDDVFLTEDGTPFEQLGEDMSLPVYVRARDDYIVFEMEKRLRKLKRRFSHLLCTSAYHGPKDTGDIIKLDDDHNFGLQSGETTFVFSCEEKQDKIREETQCFNDIPIGDDKSMFVTPLTRVLTRNSKPRPCNKHFPLTIRAEQCWLEIRPTPTPVADPETLPLEDHLEGKHLDLSSGGLYTDSETQSWEHHLEYGQFHKATMHRISNGVWAGTHGTNGDEPGYSLSNLNLPSPLSWVDSVKKEIEKHTAILCAAVLVIEGVKFLTTLAMLAMSLVKEGITGLLAVLALLMCPAHQALSKIRRRARRQTKAELEPLATEETGI